jgi:hypothetical protein
MSNVTKADTVTECALMMLVVESRAQEEAARRMARAVKELANHHGVTRSSTRQRKS